MAILDVTYFRANLTDKINGTAPGPRPGTFTSVNLPGESTREGVEVSARVKLDRNLTLGGAYTYTDARTPTGDREFRRPLHGGPCRPRLCVTGRGTATFAAIYNGRQDDLAFTMPVLLPDAARVARRLLAGQCGGVLQAAAGGGGVRAR
jgi:outer membrane receptor protein involved in Fe transport